MAAELGLGALDERPLVEDALPAADLAALVLLVQLPPLVVGCGALEQVHPDVGGGDGAVEVEEDRGVGEVEIEHGRVRHRASVPTSERCGPESHRQRRVAAQPGAGALGAGDHLDRVVPGKQLVERDPCLEPGERRAQAQVDARPEREVPGGVLPRGSKRSGSSKTAGSRFADATTAVTGSPARSRVPPSSRSTVANRVMATVPPSSRSISSTAVATVGGPDDRRDQVGAAGEHRDAVRDQVHRGHEAGDEQRDARARRARPT